MFEIFDVFDFFSEKRTWHFISETLFALVSQNEIPSLPSHQKKGQIRTMQKTAKTKQIENTSKNASFLCIFSISNFILHPMCACGLQYPAFSSVILCRVSCKSPLLLGFSFNCFLHILGPQFVPLFQRRYHTFLCILSTIFLCAPCGPIEQGTPQ